MDSFLEPMERFLVLIGERHLIVPAVLVLVSLIVAIGLFLVIPNAIHARRGLKMALALLKGADGRLDETAYNKLDDAFLKNDLLGHSWKEFSETVIKEKVDDTINIWNSRQAEDFFSFDKIVLPKLHLTFLEAVPGIVTGIGLLGTFIALFDGLQNLHVETDMQVTGIGGLINNLSSKFLSSIIGVSAAVFFLIFEKICVGTLENKCHELERRLNDLFPRVITEGLLTKLLIEAKEQTSQLKHFNTDMTSRLKSSLEESMQPTMNRMIEAIERLTELTDNFHKQNLPATEQIVASIGRLSDATEQFQNEKGEQNSEVLENMVAKFSEKLSSGANAEISNLSGVLASTSETLGRMTERMEQSMTNMESQLSSQQSEAQTQREALAKSVLEIVNRLDSHSGSYLNQIEDTNKIATARLETHLQETLAANRAQQEEQAELAKAQQNQLRETTEALMKSLSTNGSEQSEKLDEVTRSVITRLDESAQSLTANLQSSANSNSEQSAALHEANSALKETTASLTSMLSNNRSLLQDWSKVAGELSELTGSLKSSSSQIHEIQDLSKRAITEITSQLKHYQDNMDTTEKMWAQQKQLHEWLDNNVAKLLKEVNDAMIKFQDHTHQTLGQSLTEFDKALANAVGKLAGTVQDLDGSLDELTASLEKTLAKNVN